MNNTYFNHLNTVEEIKAHYKALAKKHHPDLGGCTETMQEINSQYHDALKSVDGSEYKDSEFTYQYDPETEQKVMDTLNELLKLDLTGCTVALIGTWLWVEGDTKPIKDQLKELSFRWNRKRECWQFNPNPARKGKRSNLSVDEIGKKYGYKEFGKRREDKEQRKSLPAPQYKLKKVA
mgnify:CR=1 FL=1|tara:strand:- start:208 stop:741 length:534 start_codon:yes stop_codon:yes gene_type:complete